MHGTKYNNYYLLYNHLSFCHSLNKLCSSSTLVVSVLHGSNKSLRTVRMISGVDRNFLVGGGRGSKVSDKRVRLQGHAFMGMPLIYP